MFLRCSFSPPRSHLITNDRKILNICDVEGEPRHFGVMLLSSIKKKAEEIGKSNVVIICLRPKKLVGQIGRLSFRLLIPYSGVCGSATLIQIMMFLVNKVPVNMAWILAFRCDFDACMTIDKSAPMFQSSPRMHLQTIYANNKYNFIALHRGNNTSLLMLSLSK